MTPVLAGVAAVVAVVLIVWLLARGVRLMRRGYVRARQRPSRASRRSAAAGPSPDLVERDWIYSDRPVPESALPAAAPTPAVEPSEASDEFPAVVTQAVEPVAILENAEAEAASILRQAEQRADEIIAAAEAAKAQLEREAARDRAAAEEERTKLTAFLNDVLEEVQRTGIAGNVRNLNELRRLKRESDLQ